MIQQYNNEDNPIDIIEKLCDKFLEKKFGLSWNDLPDTVCITDWVDGGFLRSDISASLIKDICWEKLADEYPDRCSLNKIIYGECSCFLHGEDEVS
jgi:hypothetical protein